MSEVAIVAQSAHRTEMLEVRMHRQFSLIIPLCVIAGCPTTSSTSDGSSNSAAQTRCAVTAWDERSMSGFTPPSGFLPGSGCSRACRMTYTDGGVMYFTIFEYLKEPEGIGALVDRRKASGPTGEPGYVLVTETTLRLANGQNAPALDWVDPIKQFYFTEVFAESSTAFVVLSVAGSADALNFYGSAVTDAILTFCTE